MCTGHACPVHVHDDVRSRGLVVEGRGREANALSVVAQPSIGLTHANRIEVVWGLRDLVPDLPQLLRRGLE